MRTDRVCFSFLVTLVLTQPVAATQRLTPVEAGARVRLQSRGVSGLVVGTVTAAEADTLIVRVDGEGAGLIVPVDSITRLEVRRERAMTLEGMGVGVLAGVLFALAAPLNWEDGDCSDWNAASCLSYEAWPDDVGTRVAVLSAVGALAGAIVGAQTKTDTWRSVRLERVAIAPVPGRGVGVGVTLSF